MRTALLAALLGLVMVLTGPTTAVAQGAVAAEAEIDYEAWEFDAGRAENLVQATRASTTFLENLRDTLVGWRVQFLAAEDANAARIETIQTQIDALGPVPEEGTAEPELLAERRATLTQSLAEAQLPGLAATEAFRRADGLISEIDDILADRQAQALLELEPTPLNPLNWRSAATGLRDVLETAYADTSENAADADLRDELRDNVGVILLLTGVGLVLLLWGRAWSVAWGERRLTSEPRTGRTALSYLISLGQVLLPLAGSVSLIAALTLSGMADEELIQLVQAALGLILSLLFGSWLAGRLFPQSSVRPMALEVGDELRGPFFRSVWWIALFTGLGGVAQTLSNFDQVSPAAAGVFLLPVYLGLAWGYWRLARAMLLQQSNTKEEDANGFALRFSGLVARALIAVAVAGPLFAAVGYLNAAEELMIPTALTLSLLGIFLSFQPVIRDVYGLVFGTSEEAARAALTPIVVNLLLAFALVPLVALIWGVRPERLGEVYTRFLEGLTIGDTRITPLTFLAVILVFVGGLIVTRLLQGVLKSTVLPRTRLDLGARNAMTSGVGYLGIALAAFIAITTAGIDLTALGFVLGALSVGIGFGLQNVVSNFVSGIILLIERPISEGDWIEVGGNMGIVKSISVRSTRIETFDKTDVIVPNADFISGTVTNWTRGNTIGRAIVTVGVAYGTDTRRVQEILLEIARSHPTVAAFPEPGVDFLGFGADSLDFRIRAILRDVNQLVSVKTELNHQIAARFAEEGIEIPFAQRDVWLRNPETLSAATAGPRRPSDEEADT